MAAEFSRFQSNYCLANEDVLSELVAASIASGELFVDSDFPPSDSSLYLEPSVASWRCHDCNKANPLNAQHEAALQIISPTREELRSFFAFIAQTNPSMALAIQNNPQLGIQMMTQQYVKDHITKELVCESCAAVFPLKLLDARATQWLRPDGVRDTVSAQYGAGAPWVVIRDQVRSQDVGQGGVGNCWFLGALAILAHQHPNRVKSLFLSDTNLLLGGCHLVRLCLDGVWRNVIVDDLLPATRHGTLVYTSAERRQLWVPLLEKAAAKLFSCYEAMQAGTLSEAFSLLTGCATERILLTKELPNDELLWAQIASAHEAKHLIGLACAETKTYTQEQLRELGLQAPHAYFVLNTCASPTRLVRLGNPWGDRSPSTWKGRWANGTSELTEAKRAGHVPNEVSSNGEFWMEFSDFLNCFASIEFCRIEDEHTEAATGWLPAATGLGDVFELVTPASGHPLHADISLYQESHAQRTQQGTSVDLGFIVLADHICQRKVQPESSLELFLKPSTRFLLVPLSLGSAQEHRKVAARVRCDGIVVRTVPNSAELLTKAIHAYCDPTEGKHLLPGLFYSVTSDGAGVVICAENQTTCMHMEVSIDADDSKNLQSSRGTYFTRDLIPPKSKQVLMILTPKQGTQTYTMSIAVAAARNANAMEPAHFPPISNEEGDMPAIFQVHKPLPLVRARVISFPDLVKQTSDPEGVRVMMRLIMKQEQERIRLYNAYLAEGISDEDATQIARDEAANLYN